MSKERADWAVRSYQQFLVLVDTYPELEFAPTEDTDEAWHAHIGSTTYADDMRFVFGESADALMHNAGLGERIEELPRLFEAWQNTLEKSAELFGDSSAVHAADEQLIPAYCGGGGGDIEPAACSACFETAPPIFGDLVAIEPVE